MVAAGHVTTQNLVFSKNLLEGWGILWSSRPNVLEYPPTLRFWMDRWSRDQPQLGSLFQRLLEAEKRDPGNEVETQYESTYVRRLKQLQPVEMDVLEQINCFS